MTRMRILFLLLGLGIIMVVGGIVWLLTTS
jgi:hypothetical protein